MTWGMTCCVKVASAGSQDWSHHSSLSYLLGCFVGASALGILCAIWGTHDSSQPWSQEGTQQPALEASSAVSLRQVFRSWFLCIYIFLILFYFKYSYSINLISNIIANKTGDSVWYTTFSFHFTKHSIVFHVWLITDILGGSVVF